MLRKTIVPIFILFAATVQAIETDRIGGPIVEHGATITVITNDSTATSSNTILTADAIRTIIAEDAGIWEWNTTDSVVSLKDDYTSRVEVGSFKLGNAIMTAESGNTLSIAGSNVAISGGTVTMTTGTVSATPTIGNHITNKTYVDAGDVFEQDSVTKVISATTTGALDMKMRHIINLEEPDSTDDAATAGYVQRLIDENTPVSVVLYYQANQTTDTATSYLLESAEYPTEFTMYNGLVSNGLAFASGVSTDTQTLSYIQAASYVRVHIHAALVAQGTRDTVNVYADVYGMNKATGAMTLIEAGDDPVLIDKTAISPYTVSCYFETQYDFATTEAVRVVFRTVATVTGGADTLTVYGGGEYESHIVFQSDNLTAKNYLRRDQNESMDAGRSFSADTIIAGAGTVAATPTAPTDIAREGDLVFSQAAGTNIITADTAGALNMQTQKITSLASAVDNTDATNLSDVLEQVTSASTIRVDDPDKAPVIYFKMNEAAASTSAEEFISGGFGTTTANTSTMTDTSSPAGVSPGFRFVTRYMTYNTGGMTFDTAMSISFWMKYEGPESVFDTIYSFNSGSYYYQIKRNSTFNTWYRYKVTSEIGTSPGQDSLLSNTEMESGNWHLCTIVYEVGKTTFYMDETPKTVDSTSNPMVFPSTITSLRIANDTFYTYKGSIDDFRIYDYALTQEDVNALYNGTPPNGIGTETIGETQYPANTAIRNNTNNIIASTYDPLLPDSTTTSGTLGAVGVVGAYWDGTGLDIENTTTSLLVATAATLTAGTVATTPTAGTDIVNKDYADSIGGGGSITTQDEGSTVLTSSTTLNFTGAGVTATSSGVTTIVNIPGGGGTSLWTDGGTFIYPTGGESVQIAGSDGIGGTTTATLGISGATLTVDKTLNILSPGNLNLANGVIQQTGGGTNAFTGILDVDGTGTSSFAGPITATAATISGDLAVGGTTTANSDLYIDVSTNRIYTGNNTASGYIEYNASDVWELWSAQPGTGELVLVGESTGSLGAYGSGIGMGNGRSPAGPRELGYVPCIRTVQLTTDPEQQGLAFFIRRENLSTEPNVLHTEFDETGIQLYKTDTATGGTDSSALTINNPQSAGTYKYGMLNKFGNTFTSVASWQNAFVLENTSDGPLVLGAYGSTSTGEIRFQTAGRNTKMTLDNAGRLGIGLTPAATTATLQVSGGGSFTSSVDASAFYVTCREDLKTNITTETLTDAEMDTMVDTFIPVSYNRKIPQYWETPVYRDEETTTMLDGEVVTTTTQVIDHYNRGTSYTVEAARSYGMVIDNMPAKVKRIGPGGEEVLDIYALNTLMIDYMKKARAKIRNHETRLDNAQAAFIAERNRRLELESRIADIEARLTAAGL